ncbi:hypothetical protein ACR6L3_001841 [Enterococcus faecalis]|nr:hypothetical protein [Enterococcus faecalis]
MTMLEKMDKLLKKLENSPEELEKFMKEFKDFKASRYSTKKIYSEDSYFITYSTSNIPKIDVDKWLFKEDIDQTVYYYEDISLDSSCLYNKSVFIVGNGDNLNEVNNSDKINNNISVEYEEINIEPIYYDNMVEAA